MVCNKSYRRVKVPPFTNQICLYSANQLFYKLSRSLLNAEKLSILEQDYGLLIYINYSKFKAYMLSPEVAIFKRILNDHLQNFKKLNILNYYFEYSNKKVRDDKTDYSLFLTNSNNTIKHLYVSDVKGLNLSVFPNLIKLYINGTVNYNQLLPFIGIINKDGNIIKICLDRFKLIYQYDRILLTKYIAELLPDEDRYDILNIIDYVD